MDGGAIAFFTNISLLFYSLPTELVRAKRSARLSSEGVRLSAELENTVFVFAVLFSSSHLETWVPSVT